MRTVILSRAAVILSAAAVILSAAKDLLAPCSVSAQVTDQTFQVTPEIDSASVGDPVTLRFRVRLDDRDLLFDTVPRPLDALAPGVRILSVEKLTRAPDRIFHGRARVAFYRTGRRAVPIFGLPFMRAVKGLQRGTLASDSAFVEIVSLAPAGNPPLKDIREIEVGTPWNPWPLLAAAGLGLLLLTGYVRLRRKPGRFSPLVEPAPPGEAPLPTAYSLALDQLSRIEQARWPEHGQVARHYEAAIDVLRDYLEAAEGLPAKERTTEELVWALPPHLSDHGLRDALGELLDEADLVKFARLCPPPETAGNFLAQCRELLRQWHEASPTIAMADALR
jgi:hypothetical protein